MDEGIAYVVWHAQQRLTDELLRLHQLEHWSRRSSEINAQEVLTGSKSKPDPATAQLSYRIQDLTNKMFSAQYGYFFDPYGCYNLLWMCGLAIPPWVDRTQEEYDRPRAFDNLLPAGWRFPGLVGIVEGAGMRSYAAGTLIGALNNGKRLMDERLADLPRFWLKEANERLEDRPKRQEVIRNYFLDAHAELVAVLSLASRGGHPVTVYF